jgi:hypothetical protein
MKCLGIMLMAALLAIAPGYGSAEQQGKESDSPAIQIKNLEKKGEQAPAAKSYTLQQKKEYQQKTTAELAEIQQKIDALKVKGENVEPQKRRSVSRALFNLDRKAATTRKWLAALETASEPDWSRVKAGLDKSMEDLRKAYETVEPHIK